MSEQPYLFETIEVQRRVYNPDYGDEKICKCGHSYIDHFELYEERLIPTGCRKCECFVFMEKV